MSNGENVSLVTGCSRPPQTPGDRVPEGSAILELAINPGRFEDLKTLMADLVEAIQKNEVGTLNYEWAISDDLKVCHVYERYRDSAAVMTHLESFGANFAGRLNGSGDARAPGCLWHTKRAGEGWSRRIGPRLHGALRGL